MAIKKIGTISNPPRSNDWTTLMSYVQGFVNSSNGTKSILAQTSTTSVPCIAQGTYVQMGGTLYIVDTEDYTIQGSLSSGSNYIYLTAIGDNLIATWVQDISGYSWNSLYNYYSDGTSALLPYLINYLSSNYYISKFDQNFRQAVNTDSSPTFAGLDVNSGKDLTLTANATTPDNPGDIVFKKNDGTEKARIYADNLNSVLYFRVGSSGVVSMRLDKDSNLGLKGNLLPTTSPTSGSHEILKLSTWTPSRGVYVVNPSAPNIELSIDGGANYRDFDLGTIFADGNKVILKSRLTNASMTMNYLKF